MSTDAEVVERIFLRLEVEAEAAQFLQARGQRKS